MGDWHLRGPQNPPQICDRFNASGKMRSFGHYRCAELITGAEIWTGIKTGWNGLKFWIDYKRAGRIEITSPRPMELLGGKQPFGKPEDGRFSYEVRGKLKRCPEGCEIWLLIEDRSGCIWPQGFSLVQLDRERGEWVGRVHTRHQQPRIVAVVAPSTSQDFFKYYQMWGSKTNYAALNRIPAECSNRTSVDARLPS